MKVKPPAKPGNPRALLWGNMPSAICNAKNMSHKLIHPLNCTSFQNLNVLCVYFWHLVWTRTEEILRTPPPSLSCTDELTVVKPGGSWLSQTSVPSKPCMRDNTLNLLHIRRTTAPTEDDINIAPWGCFNNFELLSPNEKLRLYLYLKSHLVFHSCWEIINFQGLFLKDFLHINMH